MQWLVYAPFYALLVAGWWYSRKNARPAMPAQDGV
jgi:hypothetical protein